MESFGLEQTRGSSFVADDDRGNFWMGCNSGIYSVSKLQLKEFAEGKRTAINSVPYGRNDGMKNTEYNGGSQPAGVKTSDSKIWFHTAGGVAVVNNLASLSDTPSLPLVIDRVVIDEQLREHHDQIALDSTNNKLEIHYNTLSFRVKLPDQRQNAWKCALPARRVTL